jgi:glycosyltransferase involved in cell wall biosynthesis
MPEQKILIITYYWPPSGGSGVQRWLKFVKYLPLSGWLPYVFTPENPSLVQKDESLLRDVPAEAEVIHFPIWEPYQLGLRLTSLFGKKKTEVKASEVLSGKKQSFVQQLSIWLRGNLLIPDPKIFWVRPSVSFLHDFIEHHQIRTIITTGPPHSMHLIGYKLKKKNPSLNWIADFRDPWSEWPFLDSFRMTALVKNVHRRLEKKVLTTANHIITVSPFYQNRFTELSGRRATLITNGYDEEDFQNIPRKRPDKFTIRHIGIVYEMANPMPLVEALTRLMADHAAFADECVLEYIGEVNPLFREKLERSPIARLVHFVKPVPHAALMPYYGSSSMLLVNIEGYQHATGLLPGKIFEYLATGVPVLGIGPAKSDAAWILEDSAGGKMFNPDDVEGIKNMIWKCYDAWKKGASINTAQSDKVKAYSRRALTESLTKLLR